MRHDGRFPANTAGAVDGDVRSRRVFVFKSCGKLGKKMGRKVVVQCHQCDSTDVRGRSHAETLPHGRPRLETVRVDGDALSRRRFDDCVHDVFEHAVSNVRTRSRGQGPKSRVDFGLKLPWRPSRVADKEAHILWPERTRPREFGVQFRQLI